MKIAGKKVFKKDNSNKTYSFKNTDVFLNEISYQSPWMQREIMVTLSFYDNKIKMNTEPATSNPVWTFIVGDKDRDLLIWPDGSSIPLFTFSLNWRDMYPLGRIF